MSKNGSKHMQSANMLQNKIACKGASCYAQFGHTDRMHMLMHEAVITNLVEVCQAQREAGKERERQLCTEHCPRASHDPPTCKPGSCLG